MTQQRTINIFVLLAILVMGAMPVWAQTHTENVTYKDVQGNDSVVTYNVVYLNLGGALGKKDGSSADDAVGKWADAYSKLPAYTGTTDADRDAAWDSNIIVVCDAQEKANLFINETTSGNRPATITGVWPWTPENTTAAKVKVGGRVYLNGNTAHANTIGTATFTSGTTRIGADTKFKYIRFGGGQYSMLSMYLHDAYFDVGCLTYEITYDLTEANGATAGRRATDMQLFMFANAYVFDKNKTDGGFNDLMKKPVTLTIRSGKFGRILSNRVAGSPSDERFVIANANKPLLCTINIDIDPNTTTGDWNPKNNPDDISFIAAGMTQGTEFCDVEFNITRGKIATFVGAMQGTNITDADNKGLSASTFIGRTLVNIRPASDDDVVIQRYFAGCQGRYTSGQTPIANVAFYGKSTLNMYGGKIVSGAFLSGGGVSGLKYTDSKGTTYNTTDKFIPYLDKTASTNYPFMGIKYQTYKADGVLPTLRNMKNGDTLDISTTETYFNIYGGEISGGLYGGSYGEAPQLTADYAIEGAGSHWGNTYVNVYGGKISGGVYGGGYGTTRYYNEAKPANKARFLTGASVYGNTHVNIYGGDIDGGIYGGGAGVAAEGAVGTDTEFLDIAKVYGNTNVVIDPRMPDDFETPNPSWTFTGNIYGGGAMGAVTGNTNVQILGGNITGNVFAGGLGENGHANKAKVTGNTEANIKGGTQGSEYAVYGGAQMAQVVGNTTVNLLGGTVGSAYGGGLGTASMAANITGNTQVNLGAMEDDGEGNLIATGNATVNNIFGCNNLNGAPSGTDTVNVISGTVNNNVYGGGNQAAASVSPVVNINGGAITESVYGGGYGATAVITGNPTVNVTNGTVTENVFGGGSLANTNGATTITVSGGTITNDVYGGGALANVTGSTTVNLLGGTIHDSYGGGLGSNEVAALVSGNATTTLNGSKVTGSIFGANNVNGTPKGHVKVHVLRTVPRDGQTAGQYDVAAVYGGGNQAAYEPTSGNDSTEVLIENCSNSIDYVYGGGNAAPVPATSVTIYGADTINNAFAGGNGAGDGNPGADVGYNGYYSRTAGETTTYGSGESHITVYGGTVNNVYGGSNTLGYIRTHAYVDIMTTPDGYEGEKCPLHVGNTYAGGNQAAMFCGGSMTLACSEGADVVYAGANSADIYGNIDLVINSGTYGKVFGGNNESGNVYGHIKIDIDETGCYPIMIGELYGGGNKAAYSVYGYNNDGSLKTSGTKLYDDPTINIISFTGIGRVFGGGKGETAVVYGNPTIKINPIKGVFAGQHPQPLFVLNNNYERIPNDHELNIPDAVGKIAAVYGGGNAAAVYGNTIVNIGNQAQNHHLTPGAVDQPVDAIIAGNIYGGGSQADINGNTHVNIQIGTVLGDVYGGGEGVEGDPDKAKVTGTTKVTIGE